MDVAQVMHICCNSMFQNISYVLVLCCSKCFNVASSIFEAHLHMFHVVRRARDAGEWGAATLDVDVAR